MNKKLKIIFILLTVLAIVFVLMKVFGVKGNESVPIGGSMGVDVCYQKIDKPDQEDGKPDEYNMKMFVRGDQVEGELDFLPSLARDIKTGTFKGEVTRVDEFSGERKANLIWDVSSQEGSRREELRIIFSEDLVSIGFGIMTEEPNGLWAYKDPANIIYLLTLKRVDCQ